jgi:hypothetical protein
MDTKKQIRVVDVPVAATAQEMENILNAPCDAGYYLMSVSYSPRDPELFCRAVFKLRQRGRAED